MVLCVIINSHTIFGTWYFNHIWLVFTYECVNAEIIMNKSQSFLMIYWSSEKKLIRWLFLSIAYLIINLKDLGVINTTAVHISVDESRKFWILSSKMYIKNIFDCIENIAGATLKNYGSPLGSVNHPEVDNTYLFMPNYISMYQILIGCLQWNFNYGHYYVQYTTNMSAHFSQKHW